MYNVYVLVNIYFDTDLVWQRQLMSIEVVKFVFCVQGILNI